MKDLLIISAVLVTWIVLNSWILPRLGIQTCMSGACCRVPASRLDDGMKLQEKEPVQGGNAIDAPDLKTSTPIPNR